MRNKFYAGIAAVTLALTAWTAVSGPAAHASSTCTNGNDPNCNPGAGWTEVFIVHHDSSSGFDYAVASAGTVLDPVAEDLDCPINAQYYWWYRYVNNGTAIQFVKDGSDGNFHAIGFSGNNPGAFKLQSGVSGWDLDLYDLSGFNWSYVNPAGTYLMNSPDRNNTYLVNGVVGRDSPTHWALVTAPNWPNGSCVTT